MNNQIRVVQASILGSILVNSLLILGTALLATSVSSAEPVYNTAETQLLGCLLFVSVFVFMMPVSLDPVDRRWSIALTRRRRHLISPSIITTGLTSQP